MSLLNVHCNTFRLLCLISSILLIPSSHATSYQEYLSQIEAEAKGLASTLKTTQSKRVPTASSMATTPDIPTAKERLPLGLQQEAFEATLREDFVGTYAFYQKLSSKNKQRIFQLYQQDNRVSVIRERTLKLLSGAMP